MTAPPICVQISLPYMVEAPLSSPSAALTHVTDICLPLQAIACLEPQICSDLIFLLSYADQPSLSLLAMLRAV